VSFDGRLDARAKEGLTGLEDNKEIPPLPSSKTAAGTAREQWSGPTGPEDEWVKDWGQSDGCMWAARPSSETRKEGPRDTGTGRQHQKGAIQAAENRRGKSRYRRQETTPSKV